MSVRSVPAASGPRPAIDPVRGRPVRELAYAPLSRRGRDYRMRRLLVVADVCALALGAGALVVSGAYRGGPHGLALMATIPAWLVLFYVYGLYSSGLRRVGHSTTDDIPKMAHAFLLGG